MEKDIPRLRNDIDIFPTTYQGEKAVLVKDPIGLFKNTVVLRGEALQIIGLIDGKKDAKEIQLELVRQRGGVFVSLEAVQDMICQLDAAFLLDGASYRKKRNELVKEYARLDTREAALAGLSYPGEADKLKDNIRSIMALGQISSTGWEGKKIAALVAPHIDLESGKTVYAKAYQVIKGASPKRILLLGTGHKLQESFLSLTDKDFVTPLGRIKTDKDWVLRLKKAGSRVISPYDITHKNEHSLEFQLLFLQYVLGTNFSLIPVLCGSFNHVLGQVSRPSEIPGMADFLSALKLCVKDSRYPTLIVAGVDFSHIGLKFGQRYPAASLLLDAKAHDRSLVEDICEGDVEGFWRKVQKENNRYNICGFSTLALLLELLAGKKGRLLGYDFWMEDETQSGVSFAAVAFPA
jgi:hypothetical protein